jgi:hypothetical protein
MVRAGSFAVAKGSATRNYVRVEDTASLPAHGTAIYAST